MKCFEHKRHGKIGDYVIAAVLLLGSLVLSLAFAGRGTVQTLEVSVDGQVTAVYRLPVEGVYPLEELPYPCTLVISGYTASLADTTCPGHDCQHGGADTAGETVVCLPNRLMLRLTGAGKVDTVVQ